MPDFLSYHRSLTEELHSLKNRIRDIVDDHHWQTDGEHKESALRSVLRRHLPESVLVGRGFIVTERKTSTQVDILLVDAGSPTLFKDGDLMIVTPDAVRAIVEVKTSLAPRAELERAIVKIGRVCEMCRTVQLKNDIWCGLFVYEDRDDMHLRQEELLIPFQTAFERTGTKVNCMAYGRRTLIRYWEADAVEYGCQPPKPEGESWRSYDIENFAPSYFIGNVLGAVAGIDRATSSYAWFPLLGGKFAYRSWLLPINTHEPVRH